MQFPTRTHNVKCKFHGANGSIERFLRVVRVRGFRVSDMELHYADSVYAAKLRLTGDRAAQNLQSQLEKLVDVIEIEVFQSDTTATDLLEVCA